MAFPPNYNQERSTRARKKALKALDKHERREEKAAQRKLGRDPDEPSPAPAQPDKETE